jgi:hypothetical protein
VRQDKIDVEVHEIEDHLASAAAATTGDPAAAMISDILASVKVGLIQPSQSRPADGAATGLRAQSAGRALPGSAMPMARPRRGRGSESRVKMSRDRPGHSRGQVCAVVFVALSAVPAGAQSPPVDQRAVFPDSDEAMARALACPKLPSDVKEQLFALFEARLRPQAIKDRAGNTWLYRQGRSPVIIKRRKP